MSLLELKQEVSRLTPGERQELNTYLVRLRNESEAGRSFLSQRMSEMDEGRKVSMPELEERVAKRHGEHL